MATAEASLGLPKRLWIYQGERFPLLAHGILIAAFSSSAICFSALLRGETRLPPITTLAAGFFSSLLLFLQLRISDEFKDAEDDARYRPYRAVPRGLVSLRELWGVGLTVSLLQIALALAISPKLIPLLAIAWTWLFLMSREFFAPEWLKAHPLVYLVSHMVIMPLIDLYVSAFDWMKTAGAPPAGLSWFLFVSFFNGIVVEIGRKCRAPADEERGVDTYSALYGPVRASVAWVTVMAVTAGFACCAATALHANPIDGALYGLTLAVSAFFVYRFVSTLDTPHAKPIELMSAVWTLLMYLSLGLGPMAVRMLRP